MPIGSTYTINGWAGEQIGFNGRLMTQACPDCHIIHAYPQELEDRARYWNSGDYPRNYVTIHCPNGHVWHYTGEDSELKKAKQLAKRLEDSLQWTQDRLSETKAARDHAEAQARGYKGALVKTQKRVAAGVCPYCNRTFTNSRIARHIATQHSGAPHE